MMKHVALGIALAAIVAASAGAETSVRFSPGSPAQIQAVSAALNLVGTPYKSGGEAGDGLDGPGLIQLVFREVFSGLLPRGIRELFADGKPAGDALGPGDLVFFGAGGGGPSRIGIYTGDGYFVQALSEGPAAGVVISAMGEEPYKKSFLGARRLVDKQAPRFEIVMDSPRKGPYRHERSLASQPLVVSVKNAAGRGRPLELALEKDGQPWLAQRIAPPDGAAALFRFRPPAGSYLLSLAGQPVLAFSVE